MKTTLFTGLVLAVALLHVVSADECAANCANNPNCMMASNTSPGGLSPSDTPQFIVLTNDDAINVIAQPIIFNITERHTNRNGCKMPATWYVSVNFTDPNLVQQSYIRGHEIATHTISHVANPNATEIVGAKLWLNQTAKVPLEDIRGFRSPYLLFNPEQREILHQNGFTFDSSISEQYSPNNPISPNAANRMWPYTMDCGVQQDCSISTGYCSPVERWPGLWEFPLYASQNDQGTVIGTMDPQGNMYDIYKREFDNRYYGNRAPMGIFIHAAWLIAQPENSGRINDFLSYAMTHENVFLVTVSQVLDWMKNPVPASEYNPVCKSEAELLSNLPGGKLCVMPASGCGHGVFNSASCECECQNEKNPGAGGFCKDAEGSCTVQKDFDFTNTREYFCQTPSGTPSTPEAETPAVETPSTVALGEANCGHPLVSFVGLSASGTSDTSSLYAQALKVIDGACDTCGLMQGVDGTSSMEISLGSAASVTGVSVLSSSEITVDVLVGNDSANRGLNNPACAQNVVVPANAPTVIPCEATGSSVVVASSKDMTLCDVYPITGDMPSTPSDPSTDGSAPTLYPVEVELDINGWTVEQFQATGASQLCSALINMIGDTAATCELTSVTPNPSRRRLMQDTAGSSIRVVLTINTQDPELAARALSNGSMLASILQPQGVSLDPTTVQVTNDNPPVETPSTDSPTTEIPSTGAPSTGTPSTGGSTVDATPEAAPQESSGSSTNVGAIVGGVVGGVAGLAIIAGVGFWYMKRRNAGVPSRVPSVSNPTFDATATVTTQHSPSKKGAILPQ